MPRCGVSNEVGGGITMRQSGMAKLRRDSFCSELNAFGKVKKERVFYVARRRLHWHASGRFCLPTDAYY